MHSRGCRPSWSHIWRPRTTSCSRPVSRASDTGRPSRNACSSATNASIAVVGHALTALRVLGRDYDRERALCDTHRALLDALAGFELDLHRQVHEENNILLPRIRELNASVTAPAPRPSDSTIRAWIETAPAARTGWLGALQDKEIGRALALIHRDPARDWTVASLASELALSRSAFAARFTELVGEPAIRYVTRWRMQVAQSVLETEIVTVAELADRLGYKSEAAFARAFKRVTGTPPGAIKRRDELPALTPA